MRPALNHFGSKSPVSGTVQAKGIARKLAPVAPWAAEAELMDLASPTHGKAKAYDSIFDGWDSDDMSDLLAELLVPAGR